VTRAGLLEWARRAIRGGSPEDVQAAETVLRLLDVTQPCGYEPEDVARIDGDRVQIGPLNTLDRSPHPRRG